MKKKSANLDIENLGLEIYSLVEKLYPICSSLTGQGVRETLSILKESIPLEVREVPSGTKAYDWTLPKEWNIKDAYIKTPKGKIIADFKQHNLNVLQYSVPVKGKFSLEELKPHLFSLPKQPELVPYLTSYYIENWGFCLSHNELMKLEPGEYEVLIDSELKDGVLNYGELYLPGKVSDEVLLSTYLCHPSLCNDNLSGVALLTILARELRKVDRHYSYRFLFAPETIGAISWLSANEKSVNKIKHGLTVTCVGDRGQLTYKKTRQGDAVIDRVVSKMLEDSGEKFSIVDFVPLGSDERQFCSPGFNLPVGSLMRTMYGHFKEYHTSADDLDFICAEALGDSFLRYWETISILEEDSKYLNLNPKCEIQLCKRDLCEPIGGLKKMTIDRVAISWVMNFSDGKNSLLDIACRSGLKFVDVKSAADLLVQNGLLKKGGDK